MALPQTADPALDWDLSDLYQSFWDPQFSQDRAGLEDQTRDFRQRYCGQVAQLSPSEILAALQELEQIQMLSSRLSAYPMLRFSANTRDTEAKRFLDQIQETMAEIENQLLFLRLELQQLPTSNLAQLQQDPQLASYQHYFARLLQLKPYQLSEEVEQVLNQAMLTGRQALINLRDIHLGLQEYPEVETDQGPVSTEAELSALLYHQDPELRLQSYRAIRHVLELHNPLYGYILNTLIQDHRLEVQRRGYDSCLAKQLLTDEVTLPVFESVMEGTRDRYDLFQRYYRLKGRNTGRVVRICDLYGPWRESSPAIPYAEAMQLLMAALQDFSPEYAEQARPFFTQQWIDARVRSGKRTGAFCAYVNGLHSFLMLSYTHTSYSLFTLAHELGHGLHYERIKEHQSVLNSDPPLVLAEIASTFNELLLLDHLLKYHGDAELRFDLLTQQIESQLNLLFRQSTISRLELVLHQQAMESSFDHEFINEEWLKLYQDLCGDAVELLPEHQFDWARVGHLFFRPFYCYSYTLSFVVALACYQQYLQQGKEFVPRYLKLLDTGGSLSPDQALQLVGIDLNDPLTVSQALDYTESLIEQLEAQLEE